MLLYARQQPYSPLTQSETLFMYMLDSYPLEKLRIQHYFKKFIFKTLNQFSQGAVRIFSAAYKKLALAFISINTFQIAFKTSITFVDKRYFSTTNLIQLIPSIGFAVVI